MECVGGITNPCLNNLQGVSAQLFMTLINTLMIQQCPLGGQGQYPPDYGPSLLEGDEFDFIVVGAGSSGSVVANRLSENDKWNVLVLEAGGYPSSISEIPGLLFSLQGTNEDWQYTAEPSETSCLSIKEGRCRWPRGKVIGGSSSINAMLYLRGNKRDYDTWADMGNTGWDWNSVLKYFKKLEDLQTPDLKHITSHGRGGYLPLNMYDSEQPIKEALKSGAKELGYESQTIEQPLGYFETLSTIEKGTRSNAAKAFIGKVKDRSNLKVAVNAHVIKLNIDATTKTVEGVQVKIGDNLVNLVAKKEVIVSAGSINSPQLLMLSGIGPKEHLNDLGIPIVQNLKVGENLQDHLIFPGFYLGIDESAVSRFLPHQLIDELYKYFMYRKGVLSTISITNLVGFINTKNNSEYPDIQYHHALYFRNDEYLLPELLRCIAFAEEQLKAQIEYNKLLDTMTIVTTLLNPKSVGKILLRSKDPNEKPLIYANYLTDQKNEDLELMLEGIKFLVKLLETEAISKYNPKILDLKLKNCQNFEFKSDDYWRCAIRNLGTSIYHPTGTCKMGPEDDPSAVVDSRLRVYGIKRLRVIDASIMPKIPSVNTNGPCIMIGEKGADMIREDWDGKHDEL